MPKIQTTKAEDMRKRWGNKPCNHPEWGKEYFKGTDTGDYVCLQCGLTVSKKQHDVLINNTND